MIKYTGPIVKSGEISLQFFRNDKGDFLSVDRGDGRLVIIPVLTVERALEAQWDADSRERFDRLLKTA